jgi:hypothetical protein
MQVHFVGVLPCIMRPHAVDQCAAVAQAFELQFAFRSTMMKQELS